MIKKKWFLYITEFFAGMSVMAVELGASRLLAPYFSSSQIVWTLIIGTIMIAMALGNVIGGRLADKKPNPDRLYMFLIIAAIWIICIPFIGKYIIAGVSVFFALFVKKGFLLVASLFSCLLLFVFPLLLLGMVTPSLIKYSVNDLEESGKKAGYLGALNTIGSIIGTFIPTFVTIPTVGTAITFVIFAVILFVIGAIYFIYEKRNIFKVSICFVVIVLFSILNCFFNFAFFTNNIIHQDESIYNYIQVNKTDYEYQLSTNVLFAVQSVKPFDDGLTGYYYDTALAAPMMAKFQDKENPSCLILGFGSGTYANMLNYYYPNCSIEGVEIDEKIANLSYDYFGLSEDIKINIFDGRAYLQDKNNTKKYDLIMVDAYQDVTIPFQMSSVEFFTLVKEHLTDDGVMVVNMNMYTKSGGEINEYLMQTITSVFDYAYTSNTDELASTNTELFAFNNKEIYDDFLSISINETNVSKKNDLNYVLNKVKGSLNLCPKGDKILTDDKAPVELLGMFVLDEIIEDNLSQLREQIKGKSIKEIIEMFG